MALQFFLFFLILGTAIWWCGDFYHHEIRGLVSNWKNSANRGGRIARFIMRLLIGVMIFHYLTIAFEFAFSPFIG